MNLSEVEAIVSGGESEQVEFKKTTGGRREAAETICGMLNGRGGFVLFGVTDRGEIRGMQITSDTMEDLVQELRRIEPLALLSPEVVQLGNGLCVVSGFPEGVGVPTPIRVGPMSGRVRPPA